MRLSILKFSFTLAQLVEQKNPEFWHHSHPTSKLHSELECFRSSKSCSVKIEKFATKRRNDIGFNLRGNEHCTRQKSLPRKHRTRMYWERAHIKRMWWFLKPKRFLEMNRRGGSRDIKTVYLRPSASSTISNVQCANPSTQWYRCSFKKCISWRRSAKLRLNETHTCWKSGVHEQGFLASRERAL